MTQVKKLKLWYGYKKKAFIKSIMDKFYQLRYSGKPFTIISNNCWGGDIYQALKLPYNTPFIGLFINAPCYIKLLKAPEYYLNLNLTFTKQSKYKNINAKPGYPIGLLDDIEIHFLHNKSEDEAYQKWYRRLKRMPLDKTQWFVKFDDRDNCNEDLIHEFHELNFKNQLSFTKTRYSEYNNNILLKNPNDLILLHNTYDILDFVSWINSGKTENTTINKLINKIFSYPKKF